MSADLAFQISPENLISDFSDFESWANGTSVAPDGWVAVGTAGSIARESTNIKFGTYSMKIISGATGQYAAEYIFDFLGNSLIRDAREISYLNYFPGRTLTFGMWVQCSSASKARIYINDGFTTTYSSYHTGGGSMEFLTVTVQINDSSTQIKFGCEVANNTVTAYFDSGIVCEGANTFTDFRGNNIYVRESDWDRSVTFSVGNFVIPRREGSQIGNAIIREGKLKIKVQIHNSDLSSARTIFDTIVKAVSDGVKDMRLSDDRFFKVRLANVPRLELLARVQVWIFDLDFIIPVPIDRFIGMLRNKQNISASPKSFNFSVDGSWKTYPIFYFLPPSNITISSLTLENLTTGERFSYSDTIGPGATLRVNCETMEVLKSGVDGLSYHSGDFPKLVPGTNYLRYTGTVGITILTDYFNNYL